MMMMMMILQETSEDSIESLENVTVVGTVDSSISMECCSVCLEDISVGT